MNRILPGCALVVSLSLACPQAVRATVPDGLSFVVFGDSGYIPSYERPEADEPPLRTAGEYLANEVRDHLERNATLENFRPTPMIFESALGSYIAASGLYPVAWSMDEICRTRGCDFAAMLGDNIYPDGATLGADGITDERRFEDMLDRPFRTLGEGVPEFLIYSMLGNHDWRISREAALAQVRYLQSHPRFHMPDLFYREKPPAARGAVEIFVIDTEMMLAGTTVHKDELAEDGSEIPTDELESWDPHIRPQTDAERDMAAWLERSLAESTARWKIVLGHHALWSGGGSKFTKARALRKLMMPAICRHADAFFSGDDHMLEVYTDSCEQYAGAPKEPLPVVVSGAASKYRPLNPAFMRHQLQANPQLRNLWSQGAVWGFAYARLEGEVLKLDMYTTPADFSGRPVQEASFEFRHRSR